MTPSQRRHLLKPRQVHNIIPSEQTNPDYNLHTILKICAVTSVDKEKEIYSGCELYCPDKDAVQSCQISKLHLITIIQIYSDSATAGLPGSRALRLDICMWACACMYTCTYGCVCMYGCMCACMYLTNGWMVTKHGLEHEAGRMHCYNNLKQKRIRGQVT